MKPNSQFVALALFALGVTTVEAATPELIREHRDDIGILLIEEMTLEGCEIYAELCKAADECEEPVLVEPDDSIWSQGSYGSMTEDQRTIFRRFQEACYRECTFTDDGLVIFPCEKATA